MRKRLSLLVLAFILASLFIRPASRSVAASHSVMISEVMMGDTTSAGHEFIELYNTSSDRINIAKWTLEYKSATGTSWTKRATAEADAAIAGHGYVVFDTEATDGLHLSNGMAQTSGNLRLRDDTGTTLDQLAWGEGDSPEKAVASAVVAGKSLARALDADGQAMSDSDNNAADFHTSLSTTPGLPPTAEVDDDSDDTTPTQTQDGVEVMISELFPDPTSPLTDSKDEFIELFNGGSIAANVNGWSLRDASGHSYTIAGVTILPGEYAVLKSAVSKISLNNDGDEISLLDGTGAQVDSSPNYGNAKPGLSWGLSGGEWAWLQSPTPGAPNAAAITPEQEAAAAKKSSTKTTKPKSTSSKTKAAAKKKAATSKIAQASGGSQVSANGLEAAGGSSSKLWSWLLIGLGIGTIGYGAYAYKPEILYYLHKLRAKLGAR